MQLLKHSELTEIAEEAWADAAAEGEPTVFAVWESLGLTGLEALDSEAMEAVIRADTTQHGAPSDWSDFVEHHNRVIEKRAAIFSQLYEMGEKLGEGGYSTVLHGTRRSDGQGFAIKVIRKADAKTTDAIQALENERKIWRRMRHPGICMLHGSYEVPSMILMVTELCEGGCLLDQVGKGCVHSRKISALYICMSLPPPNPLPEPTCD